MRYWFVGIAASLFAFVLASQVGAARKPFPDGIVTAESGVQYVTGGIGDDSRQRVNELARAHHFNVQLVFAWRTGNFVADIPVIVDDAEGNKILALEKSGPILMLHLPLGRYTAAAEYNGATMRHAFEAPKRGMTVVHFAWNQPANSEAIMARDIQRPKATTMR